MGYFGLLWVLTNFCGFVWILNGSNEFLWVLLFFWGFLWVYVCNEVFSCVFGSYGLLWVFMGS